MLPTKEKIRLILCERAFFCLTRFAAISHMFMKRLKLVLNMTSYLYQVGISTVWLSQHFSTTMVLEIVGCTLFLARAIMFWPPFKPRVLDQGDIVLTVLRQSFGHKHLEGLWNGQLLNLTVYLLSLSQLMEGGRPKYGCCFEPGQCPYLG